MLAKAYVGTSLQGMHIMACGHWESFCICNVVVLRAVSLLGYESE